MNDSSLPIEVLKKYPNRYFIETGTARGEAIQLALECGFPEIISIEANVDTFTKACQRFAVCDNVMLVMGDSGAVLPGVLKGVQEPATFWLDAHVSSGEPDLDKGINPCPVLFDLLAIAQHPVKGHVILIDDIRYFRRGGIVEWNSINLGDIMGAIMDISPEYRITFEDGGDHEKRLVDNILVAQFRKTK